MSSFTYDKIHGMITLTPLMLSFIDTPEFQRLRQIKQLGSSQFLFPTANHTRFEHSLGVSHLARKIGIHLKLKSREIELLSLSGLLHDIGHGPLSHSFDEYLKKNNIFDNPDYAKHENRSKAIIEIMVKKYKIKLSKREREYIYDAIKPPDDKSLITYKHDIISGEYDMDRFDYILRDSYSTIRIRFNKDNVEHIINSSYIDDNNRLNYYENRTVKIALENFNEDRKYMYKNVYINPKIKKTDEKIEKIMQLAFKDMKISIEDFTKFPFIDAFIDFFYAHSSDPLPKMIESLYFRE